MSDPIIKAIENCISDAKTEILGFICGEDLTNSRYIENLLIAWSNLDDAELHISNLKEDLK